jgi:hypothetical protein
VPALRAVVPRPRGTADRAWRRGRPRHGVAVGAAVHAAAGRGRPTVSPRRGRSLVCGRDVGAGRRAVALPLPRDRPGRAGHRRVHRPTARCHVLRRQHPRPRLQPTDRALLAALSRLLPRPRWSIFLVTPEMRLGWHRHMVGRRRTYPAQARGRP